MKTCSPSGLHSQLAPFLVAALLALGSIQTICAQSGNPPPDCASWTEVYWYDAFGNSGYYYKCHDPEDVPPYCPTPGASGNGGSPSSGGGGGGGKSAPARGSLSGGSGDGPGSCADCSSDGGEDGECCEGLAGWSVTQPQLGLLVHDTPFFYNTTRGRKLSFELHYKSDIGQNGRIDTQQPGIFGVGTNWHTPWRSYLQRSGYASGANDYRESVFVFLGDGSARQYGVGKIEYFSKIYLTNGNNAYYLGFPGGSTNVYSQWVTLGGNDYCFLTKKIDVHGNEIEFRYAFTTSGGVTNSVRLDKVIDPDGRETTFVYATNNAHYANLLVEVRGPSGYGLTNILKYDSQARLTNIQDVLNLASGFQYDSSNRVSKLTTPYGTNTFTYLVTNGWKAYRIDELGLRQHLYLGGFTPTNVLPSATSEGMALDTYLGGSSVETNGFDHRNTFYWGPRQYQNLPLSIRTNIDNLTFNPANLTTNDYKLGWTKHWLRSKSSNTNNVFLSGTISLERSPSPDSTGATEGLLTWYDYQGKHFQVLGQREYEGTARIPITKAWREPGGDWHTVKNEYNDMRKIIETWERYTQSDGALGQRSRQFEYAEDTVDLTREFDFSGTLVASNAYNAHHQVVTSFNAFDEMTTYEYNGNHQVSVVTRPSGWITEYSYDSNGFLTNVVDKSATQNFRTNSYTYANGYVRTQTDERGLTMTNEWDALGRLVKRLYSDGSGVTNVYDKLDLVVSYDQMHFSNQYLYNGFRQVIRHTNANFKVTTNEYCNCGSVENVIDPLGNTNSFQYDNLGRRTRMTYPGGSWMESTYNLLGQVVRTTDSAGAASTNTYTINGLLQASSNAAGRIVFNRYDNEDRLFWTLDANGSPSVFGYDALGRLVGRTNYYAGDFSTNPLDEFLQYSQEGFYYSSDVASPTQHDGLTDPGAVVPPPVTTYAYDALGRKTNEIRYTLGGDFPIETNSLTYKPGGELLTLTDGKGQVTTWKYDQFGRVTNKLDAANNEIFRYRYDANGRLTYRWTPGSTNAIETSYTYDAVGNLTSINYPNSPDITFSYDANNRLISHVDAAGTTAYSYVAFGAMQSEDGPWAEDTVSYTYKTNRLREGLNLLQPNATAWAQSYMYDAANRLTNVTSPAGAFGYKYHSGLEVGVPSASTLLEKLTLPNGASIQYAYDSSFGSPYMLARLMETKLVNSSSTPLNEHEYIYNYQNQRIQQTRFNGDYVDYTYDDLGQLKTAVGKESGGTTNRWQERLGYAYDGAGNLNYRTNNVLVQTFNVNGLNEINTVTRSGTMTAAGTTTSAATNVTVNTLTAARYADNTFARTNLTLADGNNTFTAIAQDSAGRWDTNAVTVSLPATVTMAWDKNGNLRTNGTRLLDYDDENQLICVTEPGSWKSEFVYDAKMRRRVRTECEWRNSAWVTNAIVRYVYGGNLVLQERNELNVPLKTYTRGLDLGGSLEGSGGIGGLLALSQTTTLNSQPTSYYYHADGNGNVTCLIDSNQRVAARYLYDPFGNTLSASGPAADLNLYRFSSKELHAASGLVYYLYRFYEPSLQRWLNRDPIEEEGGTNLYGFVGQDPIGRADLFGLYWRDCSPGEQKLCKQWCEAQGLQMIRCKVQWKWQHVGRTMIVDMPNEKRWIDAYVKKVVKYDCKCENPLNPPPPCDTGKNAPPDKIIPFPK